MAAPISRRGKAATVALVGWSFLAAAREAPSAAAAAAFGPTAGRRRPSWLLLRAVPAPRSPSSSSAAAPPPIDLGSPGYGGGDGGFIAGDHPDRRAALARAARAVLLGTTPLVAGCFSVPPIESPLLSTAFAAEDESAPPSLYLAQPMGPPGSTGSRPSAPPEYLLPASRVKVYLDTAAEAAGELARLRATQQGQSVDAAELELRAAKVIASLGQLLASPPSFVRPTDPKRKVDDDPSGGLLGTFVTAGQKQKEREERGIDAGLAPRAFEVFELSGERRQWNRLQRQERAREEVSEVRRAFNIYTSNLMFDEEKYKFKGSKEEKSKLIRDDKLPTVKSVIRSDLDLRDLYRNQVQTALEDARAEYQFQAKQMSGGSAFDGTELLGLLKDAQAACDKWFSFISEEDARKSLEAAQRESVNWYS